MKAVLCLTLVFSLAALTHQQRPHVEIKNDPITNWGKWGAFDFCSGTSYVVGFNTKVEPYRGVFIDDTALNSIQLICSNNGGTIRSAEGKHGDWGQMAICPHGRRVTGFRVRVEEDQGFHRDDTSMNAIRLICEDGTEILSREMTLGKWYEPKMCPAGRYVCGLQTQVEPSSLNIDNTSLNNVKMACCA